LGVEAPDWQGALTAEVLEFARLVPGRRQTARDPVGRRTRGVVMSTIVVLGPFDTKGREHAFVVVRKKSGEVLTGRQIDQAVRHIQLIMIDAKEHDIPPRGNRVLGAMETSLMPVGLPAGMAVEEFRDLVAYLQSLK
jgi:hypothetical protein